MKEIILHEAMGAYSKILKRAQLRAEGVVNSENLSPEQVQAISILWRIKDWSFSIENLYSKRIYTYSIPNEHTNEEIRRCEEILFGKCISDTRKEIRASRRKYIVQIEREYEYVGDESPVLLQLCSLRDHENLESSSRPWQYY